MISTRILPLVLAVALCAACTRTSEPADAAAERSSPSARADATLSGAAPVDTEQEAPPASPRRRADAPKPSAVRQQTRDMLALADAVAAQGDARALSLAALLRDAALTSADAAAGSAAAPKTDDTVRRWLDEAARMAPDDATLIALAVHLERNDARRRQALVARWRKMEPDNMVPVLYSTLPEQAMFEAAVATSVFDGHYDDMLRLITDVLARTSSPALARLRAANPGMTREEQDALIAVTFWATTGIPAFQNVTRPCREAAMDDLRRQECRWIAVVLLRRSDNLLAESAGAHMLERGLGTTAERTAAAAYKREGEWLIVSTSEAYARNSRAYARRFHRSIRETPHFTERTLLRRVAIESGFPPTPPPGWRRNGGA